MRNSTNPNIQKSKNPKIQKSQNPKLFTESCEQFWIFGFSDLWIFGCFGFWVLQLCFQSVETDPKLDSEKGSVCLGIYNVFKGCACHTGGDHIYIYDMCVYEIHLKHWHPPHIRYFDTFFGAIGNEASSRDGQMQSRACPALMSRIRTFCQVIETLSGQWYSEIW